MMRIVVYIGLIASSYGCDSKNNCIDGSCHISNAKPHCTFGCKDGFAGIFCKESCAYTCHACLRNDPRICTRCEEGRFGKTCGHKCSNCLDSTCFINGTCIEGCKSSWWGLKCDSKCQHGYDCNRLTGRFGQGSETSTSLSLTLCPQNCKKSISHDYRICNSTTRQCLHGCEEGFTGPKCQLTVPVGTEVSTILLNSSSSCQPPCFQCSDDGACLTCQGLNGEICSTCGQDGGCLDECGATCADNKSQTESSVGDIPLDIWGQIGQLFQENALMLPLLCCCLALVLIMIVGVTLKCRARKSTHFNMNPTSVAEEKEESLFANCGDIYHEIDDSEHEEHCPGPHKYVGIGLHRQLSSHKQYQGHNRFLGTQSMHGDQCQNHRGYIGHRHGEGQCHRLDGRHGRGHAFVNTSNAKKVNVTNQNAIISNSTEKQAYITPIQEVSQPDFLPTRTSHLMYVTPVQEVKGKQFLHPKPKEACSNLDHEQIDVISRSWEGSYVTAISEAEHRLIGRADMNESLSAAVVDEVSREQYESDQLESSTCTEPEVRNPLLIRSTDTEKIPEIKLQCNTHDTSSLKSHFPRTEYRDVMKTSNKPGCTSICPDVFGIEKHHLDQDGYLMPSVKREITYRS